MYDILDWIDQLMGNLNNIVKKNPNGSLLNITPMIEVSEKMFNKFIE